MITHEQEGLIWNQAKELRAETERLFVAARAGCPACTNPACGCLLYPISTRDGDLVCSVCGWVCDSGLVAYTPGDYEQAHRTYFGYKPIFHLNERIANLNCTDPHLADDLFELVELEHSTGRYPTGPALWHGHIGAILRSIEVPDELQEKYRGRRYKCLPLTDMCKKFHERWITLRYRLIGERPPPLEAHVVRGMQDRLLAFIVPWQQLRHAPGCRGGPRCHRKWGCRFKLPDCSLLMWLFMWDIGGLDLVSKYEAFLFYKGKSPLECVPFPMLRLIATCFRYNGWQAVYDDGTSDWVTDEMKGREWTEKAELRNTPWRATLDELETLLFDGVTGADACTEEIPGIPPSEATAYEYGSAAWTT